MTVAAAALLLALPAPARADCAAPANPIEAENCLPGDPPSAWDTNYNESSSIEGFPTEISVDKGAKVSFKINTNARAYTIDIYRLGYYGGSGARKIVSIKPSAGLPQKQPSCRTDSATGLIDCGNWAVSASWTVPNTATSGLYEAKLTRTDSGAVNFIAFVVRDDASRSAVYFKTSDSTWHAYNNWGGNSLYTGHPVGRAYKVSYNRPITAANNRYLIFSWELPAIRFLEANGYDVSYFSTVEADRQSGLLRNHRVFVSAGHDEYWSGGERAGVEAARDAGVHLMFWSGNESFWKTRWEKSIDGHNTPYRTLVCYKESYDDPNRTDPLDPPTWTGTWRDPQGAPPTDDAYRPENAMSGTLYVTEGRDDTMQVPAAFGKLRLWRNTSVAALAPGTSASFPEMLGYEFDTELDNGFRPAGLIRLSSTSVSVPNMLIDSAGGYAPGVVTHNLTLYRGAGGGLVFGAGSIQWAWGLDSYHAGGSTPADPRLQQAMVNVFGDMGVQPATLRPGLVPAAASTDASPPVSSITAPASGAAISSGAVVMIQGTAADSGGGVVGGVEVSLDGGAHWRRAEGTASWSYAWTPPSTGTFTLRSRATDDSLNIESPSAGVTVAVGGSGPPPNPVPAIASLAPSSATAGGPGFNLTVNGSNFIAGSVVQWNGAGRATSVVSSSTLAASIASADIASSGTASVTVFNPAPGGGTSNAATFTINSPSPPPNPVPAIASLAPNSATAGGPGFTLTVNGSNFIAGSVVQWNGSGRTTAVISSSTLAATIASADIASSGTASVTVFNPAPGGGTSNAAAFTIAGSSGPPPPPPPPAPTIARLTPSAAVAGGSAFNLTVDGTNFVSSSVVQWNGHNQPGTVQGTTRIVAYVPGNYIAAPGTATVTVFTPGAPASNAAIFTITGSSVPAGPPAISALTPNSAAAGGPAFNLTVDGSNFASNSVVQWNGNTQPGTVQGATRIVAYVPSNYIASAGTATVTVLTPGVGTSNAATFTITPGAGPAASHGAPARAAARAFPNPWRAGRHAGTALSIEGLAPGSRIRIFAPSGARVKTLEAAAGIAAWDLTNDAGQAVATGLYFFVATDSSGRQSVGHLAVFR